MVLAMLTRDVSGRIERLVGDLLSVRPQSDGFGGLEPVDVPLQADARQEFIAFAEAHAAEQTALGENLAACWSKLEGYAARFALLFQLIRQASGDARGDAVELPDMRGGIELSRWFGQEAARIYRDLGDITDSPKGRQARERAQLVEWIRERGGTVTARELQQGPRRFRGSIDAAEAALHDLVKSGHGKWQDLPTTPRGGRPARAFSLGNGYTTHANPEQSRGSVAVASVAAEKVDERHSGNGHDQWGGSMTATALLHDLQALGVTLQADGDRLRFHPRDAVTPEMLEQLREHKAELLEMLRQSDAQHQALGDPRAVWLAAVEELDGAPLFPGGLLEAMRRADVRCGWTEPRRLTARPAKPASDWPGELADFALLLTADDLPAVPFTLQPGVTVLSAERFLTWLQADIRRGPLGPRARYGALQGDMRRPREILTGDALTNDDWPGFR